MYAALIDKQPDYVELKLALITAAYLRQMADHADLGDVRPSWLITRLSRTRARYSVLGTLSGAEISDLLEDAEALSASLRSLRDERDEALRLLDEERQHAREILIAIDAGSASWRSLRDAADEMEKMREVNADCAERWMNACQKAEAESRSLRDAAFAVGAIAEGLRDENAALREERDRVDTEDAEIMREIQEACNRVDSIPACDVKRIVNHYRVQLGRSV